jgi:uncharacterized protein
MIKRYIERHILDDLKDKMVFVSGPRQVGKTTLAKDIGKTFFSEKYEYLNWDNRADKKTILSGAYPVDKKLFIFDEIHKYKNWKNYLKGEYDKYKEKFHILVTGSARLDIYRKGGDSLLGRYRSYRLHPLSLGELSKGGGGGKHVPFTELGFHKHDGNQEKTLERLLKFGGFPEVYIKQDDKELRRWHNERIDRLIKQDIRDVENIRDISAMDVLAEILPGKAGSLFSLNSLREDLNVTHKTIASWVDIFEKFYYHFRIYPFQSTLIKSLRKEPKLYLWDWSEIKDDGARFENIVASHLLKFCHFLLDVEGYKAKLCFLRDKEQRETDFLVSVGGRPWFSVEVKTSPKDISPSLAYFSKKLRIPFNYQVVRQEGVDFIKDNIRVISASKFFTSLV